MGRFRWDRITHSSVWAYRLRQNVVMGPLKRLAALSPWFDPAAVEKREASEARLWAHHLADSSVLEVGCGPGAFGHQAMAEFGARSYVGTDLSPGMTRGARQSFPSLPFSVAEAARTPFRDDAFDVVVASFLLHHVPVPERERCVGEMLRVARRLVIIRDVYGFPRGAARLPYELYYRVADGSYYRFTLDEWRALFARVGAPVIEQTDSGPRTIVRRIASWVLDATARGAKAIA